MIILTIIAYVTAIVCYSAVTFFATSAWSRLRRQESLLTDIMCKLSNTETIVEKEYIRSNFSTLNDLKKDLQYLMNQDRYEEAKELKKNIESFEKYTLDLMNRFQKENENMANIEILKVNKTKGDNTSADNQ